MRPALLLILLLGPLLISGCITMGRSTAGSIPDVTGLGLKEGETNLADVLAQMGPPDEWHRIGKSRLLIWRHRRHHYGSYGFDASDLATIVPGGAVFSVVTDNLRFTYYRVQQAEARVAILVDPAGKVTSIGQHDGLARLTTF